MYKTVTLLPQVVRKQYLPFIILPLDGPKQVVHRFLVVAPLHFFINSGWVNEPNLKDAFSVTFIALHSA